MHGQTQHNQHRHTQTHTRKAGVSPRLHFARTHLCRTATTLPPWGSSGSSPWRFRARFWPPARNGRGECVRLRGTLNTIRMTNREPRKRTKDKTGRKQTRKATKPSWASSSSARRCASNFRLRASSACANSSRLSTSAGESSAGRDSAPPRRPPARSACRPTAVRHQATTQQNSGACEAGQGGADEIPKQPATSRLHGSQCERPRDPTQNPAARTSSG